MANFNEKPSYPFARILVILLLNFGAKVRPGWSEIRSNIHYLRFCLTLNLPYGSLCNSKKNSNFWYVLDPYILFGTDGYILLQQGIL